MAIVMLMTMTMRKIMMMMLMTMTMTKIMMMHMRACARCDLSRTSDLQDCICPTPRLDFPIYPHDHQDGDDQDDVGVGWSMKATSSSLLVR